MKVNQWRVIQGDARTALGALAAESVQTCVTSPPYWGLRDYGTAEWHGGDPACEHDVRRWAGEKQTQDAQSGHASKADKLARVECRCGARRIDSQIGLEDTPDAYVGTMVAVFREVWRVLRDDGTLWLNLGDSYHNVRSGIQPTNTVHVGGLRDTTVFGQSNRSRRIDGLKEKDLVGIPWLVAFALRADGWYLRSDIIWHKPNPMPESVTDRPTKAHEYLFLLTKTPRYYYDGEAIQEAGAIPAGTRAAKGSNVRSDLKDVNGRPPKYWDYTGKRNKRSVWTVNTQPYSGAHFATYPEDLIAPCILAGSKEGDLVLDPFTGSGTTGAVAIRHRRNFVGTELNGEYVQLASQRIGEVAPMFAEEGEP